MNQIKSSVMPVTGLSCSNCARAIETNLRKIPGVTEANVDFTLEKLNITYDSSLLGDLQIIDAVRHIGYDVAIGKVELLAEANFGNNIIVAEDGEEAIVFLNTRGKFAGYTGGKPIF